MTTGHLLAIAWDWEPSVVVGCAALAIAYLAAVRFRFDVRTALFIGGDAVLLLALVSPLDALGDDYLFSAHMLQHLLLIMVVPPLLLLGLPAGLAARLLRWRAAASAERLLRRAPVAWLLAVLMLWAWHAPVLYNLTLASETVHITEHLLFLVTWTIFWWPILGPIEDSRLAPFQGIGYLFAAGVANTVLGALLTFSHAGLYPAYLHPEDELGALALIRGQWGLTPDADQQLGGLIMWVAGSLVILAAILGLLARWYRSPEATQGSGPDAAPNGRVVRGATVGR
jgi:cytochrome c oxidase assembly factor CtaG